MAQPPAAARCRAGARTPLAPVCDSPWLPVQKRRTQRASPRTRTRRSALGRDQSRSKASAAPAASASRAPVPKGRAR
eukprot:4079461-Alexandrium_andersonii.AAC.1